MGNAERTRITATPQRRVADGARALDAHDPHWWRRIDVAALEMSRCDKCVLGQLAGMYGRGLKNMDLTPDEGQRYGFQVLDRQLTASSAPKHYARLRELWIEEIKKRANA